ncbi:MAG TPA: energy transducer TonB [Rhodanobacteraceae bacterium]|nr:energy transducer TonB [Rhodanobacteraceae bacterium]
MTALIQSARFVSSARSCANLAVLGALVLALAACGNNNAPQNAATAQQPGAAASTSAKPAAASTAAQQAKAQADAQAEQAAQAKLDSMSVKQLLDAARTAMNQQKLVAPKGDNAFEYYETALQKDPKNQVAQDALRESFPFGANAVEAAIGQNNFDEAQREIGLLAKADPSNYTLTILRSKLDAAKKQQQREADQKAKAAAELAARQAAEAKAAAAAAKAPPVVQQPVVQQPQPAPVQEAPKPTPPPQPVGETRPAQVVTPAAPEYPLDAARNGTSGYATVEFTVNPDGSVSNAHVIASQPGRVFDRAAIQAVSRSKFNPALKNGQPVSSTLQRRIDFKM